MRFEIEEATSIDIAAMMEVVKNREPNTPGSRPNFVLKKSTTKAL
jgi:hypothetical protein